MNDSQFAPYVPREETAPGTLWEEGKQVEAVWCSASSFSEKSWALAFMGKPTLTPTNHIVVDQVNLLVATVVLNNSLSA